MRAMSIVSCLGVILSASAAVYTSTQYLALSHSAKTVEALAPSQDVMAPKIEALLADHKDKNLILGEMKARHENGASLHAALTKMASNSKAHALNEVLLWIGVSVLFGVLLATNEARCQHVRRNR